METCASPLAINVEHPVVSAAHQRPFSPSLLCLPCVSLCPTSYFPTNLININRPSTPCLSLPACLNNNRGSPCQRANRHPWPPLPTRTARLCFSSASMPASPARSTRASFLPTPIRTALAQLYLITFSLTGPPAVCREQMWMPDSPVPVPQMHRNGFPHNIRGDFAILSTLFLVQVGAPILASAALEVADPRTGMHEQTRKHLPSLRGAGTVPGPCLTILGAHCSHRNPSFSSLVWMLMMGRCGSQEACCLQYHGHSRVANANSRVSHQHGVSLCPVRVKNHSGGSFR